MTKGTKVQYIAENLPKLLPGKEVTISEVVKNGRLMTGVSAKKPGTNTAPMTYLECFDIEDPEELCKEIAGVLMRAKVPEADPNLLLHDKDFVRSHIHPVLCPSEKKPDDVVTVREIGDISLLLEIELFQDGFIKVTNTVLKEIGMSKEEALSTAMANNEPAITRTEDHVKQLYGGAAPVNLYEEEERGDHCQTQLVVSNRDPYHGAAVIMDDRVIARLHEMLGESFFVLPSSVHEIICQPVDDTIDVESLRDVVQMVNQMGVLPEDQLSNKVYICEHGKIRVA